MSTQQVTVTLPDKVFEELESRIDKIKGESRSQRISSDLTEYWEVIEMGLREAKRLLTKQQAKLILDVMNGYFITNLSLHVGGGLALEVNDGIDLNRLNEKWGVDGAATKKAVSKLPTSAIVAILDFSRRFWLDPDVDLDEYVKEFLDDKKDLR